MNARAQFWQSATVFGPVGCVIVLLVLGQRAGAFGDFQLVGKDVTPLQGFIILALMCFPVAAWFFASIQRDVMLSRLSRTWPTVPGVLLQRTTEKRVSRSGVSYIVSLKYAYEVGGRKYEGEQLAFAPQRIDSGGLLDSLLLKYVVNAAVTVHYNPADPPDAVLETGEELARQRMWRVWTLVAVPAVAPVVLALRAAF